MPHIYQSAMTNRTKNNPQVGHDLVATNGTVARTLQVPPNWPDADGRRGKEAAKGAVAAWLCQETVRDGHSVLMFCASKNMCKVGAVRLGMLAVFYPVFQPQHLPI